MTMPAGSGPSLRVAVLGGGRSSEHDVSLASAASVRAGLVEAGHVAIAIEIGRDGVWRRDGRELKIVPGRGLEGADVVFPALHGPFGEDGTVQGLLECLDIPYVGAGVLASAVCMDKVLFKQLMARAGIPQVNHERCTRSTSGTTPPPSSTRLRGLGLPVFVKPARLGSSVGIARVGDAGELPARSATAFEHDELAIVEAACGGIEVECSVLGNGDPIASQPGEILLGAGESGWYDYEAKYTPGGMELVVPGADPRPRRERVRSLAVTAFLTSGLRGPRARRLLRRRRGRARERAQHDAGVHADERLCGAVRRERNPVSGAARSAGGAGDRAARGGGAPPVLGAGRAGSMAVDSQPAGAARPQP